MITLRNVEKFYEHGTVKTWVLRRIDLEVKEGEFLSIMGPSAPASQPSFTSWKCTTWAGRGSIIFLISRCTSSRRRSAWL